MGLLRAPNSADQRIEHVIHHHAPASDVPDARMNLLRHVGERRNLRSDKRAAIRP